VRAGTLKARKQALLVEREQLRQVLLTRNQPKLDTARLGPPAPGRCQPYPSSPRAGGLEFPAAILRGLPVTC
jgi:hypothetical protein